MNSVMTVNPLIPTHWELTAQLAGVLAVGLIIWAALALLRSPHLNGAAKLGLLVVALIVPFLGALLAIMGASASLPSQHRSQRIFPEYTSGSSSPGRTHHARA